MGSTSALNLTFSPQEKEKLLDDSGFVDERPESPVARIFKRTANNPPSPWGEGRDEGGSSYSFGMAARQN